MCYDGVLGVILELIKHPIRSIYNLLIKGGRVMVRFLRPCHIYLLFFLLCTRSLKWQTLHILKYIKVTVYSSPTCWLISHCHGVVAPYQLCWSTLRPGTVENCSISAHCVTTPTNVMFIATIRVGIFFERAWVRTIPVLYQLTSLEHAYLIPNHQLPVSSQM